MNPVNEIKILGKCYDYMSKRSDLRNPYCCNYEYVYMYILSYRGRFLIGFDGYESLADVNIYHQTVFFARLYILSDSYDAFFYKTRKSSSLAAYETV